MPFGILESNGKFEHVPGTALLEETDLNTTSHSHLKKGTGDDANVVLIPQPSNDPNDPLNWPLWQRDLLLTLYCFCTLCCVGGVGPLLSVMAFPLIAEFNINFTQVSLLTGYNLCAVGAVGVFVSALARKFGKRPPMLGSMVLALAGTIWGGAAQSYGSLVGARIVQGFGIAMFESVAFAIIGDLYHVHQRGTRMALYILAQSGVAHLPSLIAGKISVDLGWRWVFWLLAIFLGLGLLLAVFFGWESAFNRNEVYNIDTSSQNNIEIIENLEADATYCEKAEEQTVGVLEAETIGTRDSFVKRMKPYSGTYSDGSFISMILRPFFVLINPVVTWAIFVIAFSQLWIVCISFMIAQLFGQPPYSLGTAEIGYISAGPMIGGFIGCILCGLVSDPLARWISRRNKGIYEPEFRLLLIAAVPIFCVPGYFLFGQLAAEGKSPVIMATLWGIVFVSVQIAAVATGSYLVDAFRNISVEVFIISMCFKNFLFFGFSFFLNDWLASWGPVKTFNAIGGIMLAICVTTIPVYIYGKRLRAWWHSHDVFSKI